MLPFSHADGATAEAEAAPSPQVDLAKAALDAANSLRQHSTIHIIERHIESRRGVA